MVFLNSPYCTNFDVVREVLALIAKSSDPGLTYSYKDKYEEKQIDNDRNKSIEKERHEMKKTNRHELLL